MSESRWFRVNVDWWESDWLHVLSAEAQLAWIKLLGRVKSVGVAGSVKQSSTSFLAHQWMQSEESVRQMLKAAEMAGALVVDEDAWVITGWKKFQSDTTAAERQQALRDRRKATESAVLGSNSENRNGSNGRNALRNGRNGCHADNDNDNDNNISCRETTEKQEPRPPFSDWWDQFKSIYPKRNGDLGSTSARKKLETLYKSKSFDPESVLAGVTRYRRWAEVNEKIGTSFIAMMSTWVNQERWLEEYNIGNNHHHKPENGSPPVAHELSPEERYERMVQNTMDTLGWSREEVEKELRTSRAG